MKYDQDQIEAAKRNLKNLRPGDAVYTKVDSVSRSGMSRSISFYRVQKGEIQDITWSISRILDYPMDRNSGGMKVGGCGMDMCFHCVYSLGRRMFPKGFTHRPNKKYGRYGQPGTKTPDGGYALDYRSL